MDVELRGSFSVLRDYNECWFLWYISTLMTYVGLSFGCTRWLIVVCTQKIFKKGNVFTLLSGPDPYDPVRTLRS